MRTTVWRFFLALLALVSTLSGNNHNVRAFSLIRQQQQQPTRHPCNYATSTSTHGSAPPRVAPKTRAFFFPLSPKSAKSEHYFVTLASPWWRSLSLRTATKEQSSQERKKSSSAWKALPRIGVALALMGATTVLAGGVAPAWAATSTAAVTPAPLSVVNLAPMLTRMQEFRLMGRLWYAALLGAAVGKERSTAHHHPAGVRTLALVSLGSAAFTLCSIYGFGAAGKFDTSRMASAVASGIGFIGAGVITTSTNRNESVVHGLTTAAAVWISAAVGVTCGTGLYILATSLAMATLGFLRIGGNVKHKRSHRHSDEIIAKQMFESDPELLRKLIDWEKVNLPELAKTPKESTKPQRTVKISVQDEDDECLISKRYFPDDEEGEKSCKKEEVEAEDKNESPDDDFFYDGDDDEVIIMATGRSYGNETEEYPRGDDMQSRTRHSRPSHYDDDVAP